VSAKVLRGEVKRIKRKRSFEIFLKYLFFSGIVYIIEDFDGVLKN